MTKNPTEQTQIDLETLYSKYQLMDVLRSEFKEYLLTKFQENNVNFKFYIDVMVQIYLHRQADVETMVGILYPTHGNTPQIVADKLLHAVELDLLDYNTDTGNFIVIYSVSDEIVDMLDRYQYPLPMVVEPKEVTNNYETGYHTISNSIVLNGSSYFNNKDMCLDHINRANSVPLELDFKVITSKEGRYKKPRRKVDESFEEHKKRVRQSDIFYSTSYDVMETLESLSDRLWLNVRYDRRGRSYSSGYHINYQGTDFNKAVLQLSEKEVLS